MPSDPVLVVHGGAWAIPDDMVEAHLNGVRNAIERGWEVLSRGGSALDAVEEAVVILEDDETFDAGRGSFLNREGKVQLDALIMDGVTLRAGGVGCVEHLRNPVREVERLREFQARAVEQNPDLFAPAISHDTVGAVALDHDGNIAAATSTGGTLNKASGRLGDSSLIGCGCYADNRSAAASTTGWGEPIMKLVLAKWAADRVASGNAPEWVAAEAVDYLKTRLDGHGGMILLDSRGRFGIAHNTPRMAWASKTSKQESSGIQRS